MLPLPEGFHTVTHYVVCDAPLELAAFMQRAFGALELGRTTLDNGRIANLQIKIGDTALMLSEACERYPATKNAAFYVFVNDADFAVKAALDAGGFLEMSVADMPYNNRQGGVKDPFGNIWWLSQRLTERGYHDD